LLVGNEELPVRGAGDVSGLVGDQVAAAIFRVDPASGARTTVASGAPFVDPEGLDIAPPLCKGKNATIVGSTAADKLTGSPFADVIVGLTGKDRIAGGKGKDLICGGEGKDKLNGGKGKDRLFGGAGKDKLVGGKGKDKCVGGKGADTGRGCERGKL